MIISKIECASLLPLLYEILQIRKTMEEAVESGKIRELTLGSDSNSVLLQHSVTIELSDLTLLDIDLLQKSASKFILKSINNRLWQIHANMYPAHVKLNDHMELFDYVKEYTSISASVKDDQMLSTEDKETYCNLGLLPIGSYKFEGVAVYTGINILSLFNGFLESALCKITNNPDDIWTDDFCGKLEAMMAENFMHNLVSAAKSDSLKLSLMENVINDSRYDYLPQKFDCSCTMSQINYHEGILNFLGCTDHQFIDGIRKMKEFKEKRSASDNLADMATVQYICRFQLKDLLVLKFILKDLVQFHSTDSFEILYSSTNMIDMDNIPAGLRMRYLNRVLINLSHYKECKKIVDKDPVLGAPINKYNLILACTPCRCMVEVEVQHLDDVRKRLRHFLEVDASLLNELSVTQINQALNKSESFLSKI